MVIPGLVALLQQLLLACHDLGLFGNIFFHDFFKGLLWVLPRWRAEYIIVKIYAFKSLFLRLGERLAILLFAGALSPLLRRQPGSSEMEEPKDRRR
ncbi:MAG: hypothetical protein C4293_20400 [Nitrospiraceae bacterium]